MQFPFLCSYSNCFVPARDWSPLANFRSMLALTILLPKPTIPSYVISNARASFRGNATLMLVLIILSILTILTLCFSVAGRLVGNVQIHFELIILLLIFILTCVPKGTGGAFWANPDSRLITMIVLTSLILRFIQNGLGAFVDFLAILF